MIKRSDLARVLFTLGLPGFATVIWVHHLVEPPVEVGYDIAAAAMVVALFVDAERLGKIDTGVTLKLGLERDAMHEKKYGKYN